MTLLYHLVSAIWCRRPDTICIFASGKNKGIAAIQLAASNSPPDWHGICQGWFTNTESATRV